MAGKDQYTAKEFIDAIPHTGGVITLIAQKVGCVWNTAKKYIDTHPTVKQAYDDEVESILDMGEAKLFEAVKDGEFQAIKYLLSTRGKKRGYVERIEQDVTTKGESLNTIGVRLIDYRVGIAEAESGPGGDHTPSSQDENPGDGSSLG
jgi:hypothetical protein